ncbi:MAG TPA: hypothetical protein VI583_07850 [Cyclobacteriaceae bacterium]|nr:hypothetical protein [Cyclobacteriaceae bacterium]
MKKIFRLTGLILFSFIESFTCMSQGFQYEGPGFDEAFFFPIGWSQDGKRLAYGFFESYGNPQIGEDISNIEVKIIDLVTDEIIWQANQSWPSSDHEYPSTAAQAWPLLNRETPAGINTELINYAIEVPAASANFTGEADFQYYTIQYLIRNDEISIRIDIEEPEETTEMPMDPTMMSSAKPYSIFLESRNLGEKKISEGWTPSYSQIYVRGYVINPDESRIVILLHKYGRFNHPEFDTEVSEYLVVGGHLRAGFKFIPK